MTDRSRSEFANGADSRVVDRTVRTILAPLRALITICLVLSLLLPLLSVTTASRVRAQDRPLPLIRDAEIEHILATFAKPLFRAANLDDRVARTYIVNDSSLNAFVAGGQRIFVFTGLILEAELPRELVGVLAHETGHIRGGHLSRTANAISGAQTLAIIGALLGGIAAAATGQGQAAGAIISGGSAIGTQTFLAYSRTQESAADQAGVELMEAAGWSPRGLVEFLRVLDEQDFLRGARDQSPYMRTHPLSFDRIEALEHRVEQSPLRDREDPPELVRAYNLMRAKLSGFVRKPQQTLQDYPAADVSDVARYARSVAFMRLGRTDDALAEIDHLIERNTANPYFVELRGQILLEGGRVPESLPPLRDAVARIEHPAVTVMLAQALVANDTPETDTEALDLLQAVTREEPDNSGAWRQLAIIHGRRGDIGLSMLASAEQYFFNGQIDYAGEQASRALGKLPKGSPDYYRALDIQNAVNTVRQRQR